MRESLPREAIAPATEYLGNDDEFEKADRVSGLGEELRHRRHRECLADTSQSKLKNQYEVKRSEERGVGQEGSRISTSYRQPECSSEDQGRKIADGASCGAYKSCMGGERGPSEGHNAKNQEKRGDE
jgi:hypothetical protein